MSEQGTIIANGETNPLTIQNGPAKITFAGIFGGATITVQELIEGEWVTLLDDDTAVTWTTPNANSYNVYTGDQLRFSTAGATGTTHIPYRVTYN